MASLAGTAGCDTASGAAKAAARGDKKYGGLKKNPRLAAARASSVRINSTSTLYVRETLSQPDNKTTIGSVAEAVIQRMTESMKSRRGRERGERRQLRTQRSMALAWMQIV